MPGLTLRILFKERLINGSVALLVSLCAYTQYWHDLQFNLETPESDLFKDNLRLYRSISISNAAPVFALQVLLSVPELNNNQVLVYLAPDSSRVRIEPTPKYILLESWNLVFAQGSSDSLPDVAPSTIYKHGIPLFRSLYTLLRILPAWKLYRRLKRRMGGAAGMGAFTIKLRLREGESDHRRVLGFGEYQTSRIHM
jgi:autophagy-related protein 13